MEIKFNPALIKLIIGLGNPGKEYENTYHNAGFLFVDYFKKEAPTEFKIGLKQTKTVKTDCFMNVSGIAVKKTMKKIGAKPAEIIVVHDDSDIDIGSHKLSFDRNPAGHKGVESVIKNLKTKKFLRLRIGVRKKNRTPLGTGRTKAGEFVLKPIAVRERKILAGVFAKTISLLENSN